MSGTEKAPRDRERVRGRGRSAVLLGGVGAVAALALTGWSGWSYARAAAEEDLAYGKARDTVLEQGSAHVARLNSIDGTQVREGLREWRAAATGPLLDELKRTGERSGKVLQQDGTSTRATVTEAAVTALDTRAGTATLIAALRVEATPREGEATTDRKRFEAGLARTSDGWKIDALTALPVGAP
ncbi:hypothetical protein ACWGJ2_21155 [Streptomyces sp. NPDC054796]